MGAARVPTFGTPSATTGGFTVAITNFDAAFTWTGTATASGSVAINGAGLVTVTGVASSTSSTLTVTTTRTGYATGSATVTQTSAAVTCAPGGGETGTCVLGATGPGGGIVFYVNETATTGARYMEAAPNTWSGVGADPRIAWGTGVVVSTVNCSNYDITASVDTAIGTGLANTTAITIACTAAQAPAAWAAWNYTGGGLATGSWFLPSQLELNQLCRYASSQVFDAAETTCTGSPTPIGGFAADRYWSSSQNDADRAWNQYFDNGIQLNNDKRYTLFVRPVRAF
jgi:hypothetical protein